MDITDIISRLEVITDNIEFEEITITEVHDYLRMLFARVGIPKCPDHGLELNAKPVVAMVADTIKKEIGQKISVFSPIIDWSLSKKTVFTEPVGSASLTTLST